MTNEASLNPLTELNNPTEINNGFGLWVCVGFCWASFIFVLGQIFEWGTLKEISLVSDAMQAAVAAVAVLLAWRVTKHPAIDAMARRFWRILTVAYFSYAVGHWLWLYYSSVLEIEPFPSWADVGFLGFYPLMLWALLAFPTDQNSRSDRRTLVMDIAIVMLAGTMVVWHFIVQPTLATVTDADWLTPVLNISYTVGDLVLMLGITTILLRRVNAVSRRTLWLIVFGLINTSIADFGFAYLTLQGTYFSGHWIDNFFISGMLFTMIASHFQYQQLNKQTVREEEKNKSETAHSFGWLPYSAVLIGCGLLLFESRSYWSEPLGYLIFASLGITALVVFRQIAAVKENTRLLAEQAARQSETHFRTLVEHSSDLIAILDVKGFFTYQSPSFKTILGYETDALIGRHSLEFVKPEDAESIKNDYRITLGDSTAILKREYAFRHADGSWRILESITKTVNEENKVSGILFNLRDVTERRTAENKLRAFTAKLENSNRELQDFAFVASHDLQEPLRKVQAFGDRLKSKYGEMLPENGIDYLDRMQSAARRMQTLITDLLTFSRVTTKAKPFAPVNPGEITREVLSDLEVKIGETEAVISVGEFPVIDADATQMRQLMQNLIGNALKFRRADAAPEIKVYQSETGAEKDLPKGFCRIIVEDNGIGFDEKYLDRIFTVFQRLHGRGEYEGSGVGLAVCRKIVERHGGTLTAHSEPERGAKFIISLPKIQENTGETDETGFPDIHDSISR